MQDLPVHNSSSHSTLRTCSLAWGLDKCPQLADLPLLPQLYQAADHPFQVCAAGEQSVCAPFKT